MKKTPLLALAAAVLLCAGAAPALAGDRVGFSFGVVVGDGGRGYYGHDRYYERERWEREHCHDRDRYRSSYDRPYGYGPYGRVVVVERPHDRGWHRGWRHDWDD